ncbi:MAG: sigma-70 family RNA polymerase sigma factor [Actinomycetota bacterium]
MRRPSADPAFMLIYDACYTQVFAYCLRRVGAADAVTVTSDVFCSAWSDWEQVPTGAATLPWLLRAARSQIVVTDCSHEDMYRPVAERDERLKDALCAIPERDREILLLSVWEGLPNAEIGEARHCTDHAVTSSLRRTRSALERELQAVSATAAIDRLHRGDPLPNPVDAADEMEIRTDLLASIDLCCLGMSRPIAHVDSGDPESGRILPRVGVRGLTIAFLAVVVAGSVWILATSLAGSPAPGSREQMSDALDRYYGGGPYGWDVDDMIGLYADDAVTAFDTPPDGVMFRDYVGWLNAIGWVFLERSCVFTQVRDEHVAECDLVATNDFYLPGGVEATSTEMMTFNEDGMIIVWGVGGGFPDESFDYWYAFRDWLLVEYPHAIGEVFITWNSTPRLTSRAAETALEYVDEFVAASDRYPIDSGSG